jgi:non-lysosomal glucosylceramidase
LGARPPFPFVYADEVWTGIEYQAAASMIWSGYVSEGLEVVKTVRDKYRGFNRNPFAEIESGRFYARAMSSWGVLLALSGFVYDGTAKSMRFDRKLIIWISIHSGRVLRDGERSGQAMTKLSLK